jgi:adenylosuccinate synthase
VKAKIVVGLGFGDEGKGITTDYLATKFPNSVVVRYCGGHQAGHTVVKDGVKHIHASYGSGTLRGVPSYISEHCCFYPPNMERENGVLLNKLGKPPSLTIHPLAKLTTPYDVAYNRLREMRLGHGSCGIGIGTTMARNQGQYKLHAVDVLNREVLNQKLLQIKKYYDSLLWEYNARELKYYSETLLLERSFFEKSLNNLSFNIQSYDYLTKFQHILFEGAQGILLDMDFGIFPNVTFGHTSSKNAITICNLLSITDIEVYYVTRCYLTRHGNGWIPFGLEPQLINNQEEINEYNEWQGSLRVTEINYDLLNYALKCDDTYSFGLDKHLVVTCLDQRPGIIMDYTRFDTQFVTVLESHSPESKDIRTAVKPRI